MEDTAPLRTSTVTLPPLPRTHGNAPDNATIATDRRSLLKKRAAVIVGLLALTAGLLVLGDIGDAFDNHLAGLGVDGQDLALLALDGLIAVLGTGDDDDLVVLFDMNLIHSSILPITALREPAKRSS
mgnify:CR=1 FL=1